MICVLYNIGKYYLDRSEHFGGTHQNPRQQSHAEVQSRPSPKRQTD